MTVSNGLTIQKMIALRNLLALLSMLQVKHVSPVILIVFTFLTLTPKDLSGMKFAAKRLTTITQSPQLPGNMMDLKFLLVPFVVQLIFLMFVSKKCRYKGKFEFTYVSLSQVLVTRIENGQKIVLKT